MHLPHLRAALFYATIPAGTFVLASAMFAQAAPANLTGTWQLTLTEFNRSPKIQIVQQGNTLSGKLIPLVGGELPLTGTVEADKVNFTVDFRTVVNRLPRKISPEQALAVFTGTINGGTMQGTARLPEVEPGRTTGWTAQVLPAQ